MAPDAKVLRAFHELGEELAGKGAQASKMFGMPTLMVGRKAFAGVPRGGGGLVFKLSPDDVQAALKLKGAELFDPGMGRPMKEWVVVPSAHKKQWKDLGASALEYVAISAAKTPEKR
jgi:hypothetical protein